MAILYGIPYMGSKSRIAPALLSKLPNGERFVDLFGGGFSMTHCRTLSGKYKRFLYNDYNPLIVNLVRDACNGRYNYRRFKPNFVTRTMFFDSMEKDGYIKYIWSFGTGGSGYLFGFDRERFKHARHDFVVFGKPSRLLDPRRMKAVKSKDIHKRRMEFSGWRRKEKKNAGLYMLEQLQRLERLQQLEQIPKLERLELSIKSYEEYEYQEGDVVYCDPPYEGTRKYDDGGFDHYAFYKWAATRPYQIWFSSYPNISYDFKKVYAIKLNSTLSRDNNSRAEFEVLYTNKG